MNRFSVFLMATLFLLLPALGAAAEDGAGRFVEYEQVEAFGLPPQRLTVWLPPGYDDDGEHRYPVIYMHDGHNLFDPRHASFGRVWAADKAVRALVGEALIEPHIIVGIWAPGEDRYRQYLPHTIYDLASPALKARIESRAAGPVLSQAYLAWLSGSLKDRIDAGFRTRPDRQSTSIMGSSMGGLMSCYAFMARPEIYGRAACISSHWPVIDPEAVSGTDPELQQLLDVWFAAGLGQPQGRRLWMDHGTETLDAYYGPYQVTVDARVDMLGWQRGVDFESRVYEGAAHDEQAWAERLPEILTWLLSDP